MPTTMSNLNFVDLIILVIFFFSIVMGLSRGLVSELVSLATLIAAFVVAIMFANSLASILISSAVVQNIISQTTTSIGVSTAQPVSYLAIGLSFGLLFAGTVIVGTIIKTLLNLALQSGILGIGNRLLGGIFGLVRGFLINVVLIFVVQLSPLSSEPWWQQSQLVPQFQPAVIWLGGIVSPALANLKQQLGPSLQDVGSQFQNVTKGFYP